MAYSSWREAVAEIARRTGAITPAQKTLFELGKEVIPHGLPAVIAAARLRSIFAEELGVPRSPPCTAAQREYMESLETETLRVSSIPRDAGEASAWVEFLHLKQRQDALETIEVDAGDVVDVQTEEYEGVHAEEVTSIGGNGRLFFKGGGGSGSWPDSVMVLCKKSDRSAQADDYRKQAANNAVVRGRRVLWTEAKQSELESFQVKKNLTSQDVDNLESVLDSATDERPLQSFLQENPHVIGALLGGHARFVLPQVRFSDKYVADFLLCDVNSLGLRWVLVELETLMSGVTLKTSNELDQYARKGAGQIREWREWITTNLAHAGQSKTTGGLGLFDIRPRSEGLVLVGRRRLLLENSALVRNQVREESSIRIHTYDWLVEQLRGLLLFSGPPGLNPYIFHAKE